jgi:hypothetical protein
VPAKPPPAITVVLKVGEGVFMACSATKASVRSIGHFGKSQEFIGRSALVMASAFNPRNVWPRFTT